MKESWEVIAWRFVRGAVAAGIATVVAVQPDFTNPQATIKVVIAAFVSGFLLALSKSIRMQSDSKIAQNLPV